MKGREKSFVLLLHCLLLLAEALGCPAPFSLQADRCLFVNSSQSSSWCSANRQCAEIGGELANSYDSVKAVAEGGISEKNLWVGLSDLADERNLSTAGWQRVNGNGVFPDDASLFDLSGDSDKNCLRSGRNARLQETHCNQEKGFVCEFVNQVVPMSAGTWMAAEFKRDRYDKQYCFEDVQDASNSLQCMAAAVSSGRSRHVLYNGQLKTCRLLQFTDSRVQETIETSADWIKLKMV